MIIQDREVSLLSSVVSTGTTMRSTCWPLSSVLMVALTSPKVSAGVPSPLYPQVGSSPTSHSWQRQANGWISWSSVLLGDRMVTVLSVTSIICRTSASLPQVGQNMATSSPAIWFIPLVRTTMLKAHTLRTFQIQMLLGRPLSSGTSVWMPASWMAA